MELTQSLLQSNVHSVDFRPSPPASPDKPDNPAGEEDTFGLATEHINFSQGMRYAKDFGCLLADAKTAATVTANLVSLPPGLTKYLGASNGIGVAGGMVSLGFDLYGAKKVFDNPVATHKDKVVDVVHIALSDVLATASGSLPLFTSINNPLTMAIYVGGQAIGIGCDVYKTIYDLKQHALQVVNPAERLELENRQSDSPSNA
jgi:hypothetical protein